MSKRNRQLAETLGFLGAGATLGLLLALACELSGHPWWALLMLVLCASGPGILRLMVDLTQPSSIRPKTSRTPLSRPVKLGIVLLMIGATLVAIWVGNINPRDYAYVPLLPPVLLTAAFFGFGYGVLAIVLCTTAADYFFLLPVYDFQITHIEDLMGLSVFAVLGACLAWVIQQFIPPDQD